MYRYKPKEKKHIKFKRAISLSLIIILVSIFSILLHSMYLGIEIYTPKKEEVGEVAYNLARTLDETKKQSKEVVDVIEEISKSIVGISKIKNVGNSIFLQDGTSGLGLGTGMIITNDGYILTNQHVCGNKYSTCYVTLENGKLYSGNVVWADSDIDLAIVKINAKSLKNIKFGDSENIKVGEQVYAIGNPIGYEFQRTVTSGIISAVNRTIKIQENQTENYMENLIQTDATINPGNSGGPLINLNGEVIGVNTIKITSAEGIGFAVPINIIKPIVEKLVNTKDFEEAYLGIFGYDQNVIPYLNSSINFAGGVYVAQIVLDGPVNGSGLKVGDVITKIDNTSINKMCELRQYIYSKNPDDEVTLFINRNNKEYSLKVKLGRRM